MPGTDSKIGRLRSGAVGLGKALAANRWVFLAGIPVLLILVVISLFALQSAASERDEQAWVLHTYQVMDQGRKILADVLDAETGQRGYLLTHQPSFLAPYKTGVADANRDIETFKNLTTDNPREQIRISELRTLVDQRFGALDRTLAVGSNATTQSPQLLAALNDGKARMGTLRALIAGGLAEERALLAQRIAARHAAESQEITAVLITAAVVLLALLLAGLVLVRNNLRLTKSEAERDQQATLLQATLDNIRDGVAVFDNDGKLVAFNNNFFGCMGFPEEMAVPGTPISRFAELSRTRKHATFEELPYASGEGGGNYANLNIGDRFVEAYRNHVPNGGFLVACLDVSARVRSEVALRQSQKMETIGQLTGGVAHDFNNLLQVISANLDLLAGDLQKDSRTGGRLQNAISAVERGSRLTAQLLAFARRQTLAPRATNLGRLINDMTDLLRRTLGERIEVESSVAGGLWNTLIDQNQLENAILNLAINSRDAMPDGGRLTIEVANAFLDEAYAHAHSEVAAGQYVMVAVSDTGSGMPAEVAARAFDPFFTTKPEGKGTGLGLSQVYGFVKQSGGHIKIYSEAGEGTTIKLYLPRSTATAQWTAPVLEAPVAGSGETVLVVEDDDGVRAAVCDLLSELGYSVLRAEGVEQALSILNTAPKIDLLFTDVVMPGPMKTRELARIAKEKLPDLKVLFTSGYTQNAIVHNGRLDEGIELLSKPYRKDDLARKLRALLDSETDAVSLPIVQTNAAADAPKARIVEDAKRKILIVEDEALIRMTTVDMVEELGYTYAEAGNATEALEILRSDPDIAILLTDLGLPGMNGAQLVGEARKIRGNIAVIVASGYSTESNPHEKDVLETVTFLSKPFNLMQLRKSLENV
jgi:signal transduction histidine kinase/CheY-like chemotaxis protein/CHASE3 domain sensor protein